MAADLGLAALVGLALVVLLFFAHARETAALRRRADELWERVSELENRLADAPSARAPAPPAQTPVTGGQTPARPGHTHAATSRRWPGPSAATMTEPGSATSAPATGTAVPPDAPARTQAAAVNGGFGARARPVTGLRQQVGRGPRRRARAWRLGLLELTVLIAAAAVALVLTSSGGHRPAHTTRPAPSTAAPAVNPSAVSVAVLNGTPTAGVATTVATRLTREGFAKGPVTNAADQTRTATTVAYMPGSRAAALSVARALGLKPASVGPIDSGTRAVACGGAAGCTVTVVVTVGSHYPSR